MNNQTMTGRVAGNYRILEKLGEGGMGAVYHAVDGMVERQVAIKVLKPEIAGNPEVLERFRTFNQQQGAVAGFAAGEVLANSVAWGTRDLMGMLFGGVRGQSL